MGDLVGVRQLQEVASTRHGLQALARGEGHELDRWVESAASRTVLPRARALTPRASGRLAGSLEVVQYKGGAALSSRLPYANVQHWGGTTGRGHRPRVANSGSVKVKGTRFAYRAGEERMEQFAQALADQLDTLIGRHGLQ
jgi:hypothetical protein